MCLSAPPAPAPVDARREAAIQRLRSEAEQQRAARVHMARNFNVDGEGLPELLLASAELAGFGRLKTLQKNITALEAQSGGFIPFHRQIIRNVTLVCLQHLFGADFESARPALCEMFSTNILQTWTFVMAPRQVGKTKTVMVTLGAIVAAGAYLNLLFMHETAKTVMKDIADMVAAAQHCDPTIEWRGDRSATSWLVRRGGTEHMAVINFGSFTQPNVSPFHHRPTRPLCPPCPPRHHSPPAYHT